MDQWERGWNTLIFRDDSSAREDERTKDRSKGIGLNRTDSVFQSRDADNRRESLSLSLIHSLGDVCIEYPVTISICRAPPQVYLLF